MSDADRQLHIDRVIDRSGVAQAAVEEVCTRVLQPAPASDFAAWFIGEFLPELPVDGSFTGDDVWRAVPDGVRPPEPRALGGAVRRARKLGLIESTETYRPSDRVECHGRPQLVWRKRGKA